MGIHAMPAERVKKLELINFSWASDASAKSLGKSPESVVALASSLANASAKMIANRAEKVAGPSVECATPGGDGRSATATTSVNTTESADGVPSTSTNDKLDETAVAPQKVGTCTPLSPTSCLRSPQSAHHPVEKKATVSPETPVLETPQNRYGAVTPETASVSRSLSFSSASN